MQSWVQMVVGKVPLANVLAGKEDYEILSGEINFKDKNFVDLNIEERAQEGIFLAFQYPIEIPGVNITPFLHAAINSKKKIKSRRSRQFIFCKTFKSKSQ